MRTFVSNDMDNASTTVQNASASLEAAGDRAKFSMDFGACENALPMRRITDEVISPRRWILLFNADFEASSLVASAETAHSG